MWNFASEQMKCTRTRWSIYQLKAEQINIFSQPLLATSDLWRSAKELQWRTIWIPKWSFVAEIPLYPNEMSQILHENQLMRFNDALNSNGGVCLRALVLASFVFLCLHWVSEWVNGWLVSFCRTREMTKWHYIKRNASEVTGWRLKSIFAYYNAHT